MASELNNITILKTNNHKLVILLKTSIFTFENLKKKSLYLDIISEFFNSEIEGNFYTDNFGNQAVLNDNEYLLKAKESPFYKRMVELCALAYGEKKAISESEYWEYRKNKNEFENKFNIKTAGAGSNGGNYFLRTPKNLNDFVIEAEKEINSITILNSSIESDIIKVEIEINVYNADLLTHLVPGTVWTSAIYPL